VSEENKPSVAIKMTSIRYGFTVGISTGSSKSLYNFLFYMKGKLGDQTLFNK